MAKYIVGNKVTYVSNEKTYKSGDEITEKAFSNKEDFDNAVKSGRIIKLEEEAKNKTKKDLGEDDVK